MVAIGSLLIRGFSAVVAKCGYLLIAAGAMMIDRFENENLEVQRGESNNMMALDFVPFVLKVLLFAPQAYLWNPKQVNVATQLALLNTWHFRSSQGCLCGGIMLLYNIFLVERIAG